MFLLPPDPCDWVLEDDAAQSVIETVERVHMGALKANRRRTCSAQYYHYGGLDVSTRVIPTLRPSIPNFN